MDIINRSAAIVIPKQPFLEWAKLDDETGIAPAVYQTMREEPNVYLLPEYEDDHSKKEVLEDFWPQLVAAMLGGWLREETMWPHDRTFEMFNEWFEVRMMSIVEDLYDEDEILYLESSMSQRRLTNERRY